MSEIYHLFNTNKWLQSIEKVKICSIGCGPATDLFGVARFLFDTKNRIPISYIGFDLNNYWDQIHDAIEHRADRSKHDIKFTIVRQNIFDIYNTNKKWPQKVASNILILQYVLSDMVANDENVTEFLEKTANLIVSRMSPGSIIIINDINHYDTRDFFYIFYNMLKKIGDYSCCTYHFENNNRKYYEYGEKHQNNDIVLNIPDFLYEYNVWTFCSSAQIIIRKNN